MTLRQRLRRWLLRWFGGGVIHNHVYLDGREVQSTLSSRYKTRRQTPQGQDALEAMREANWLAGHPDEQP